MNPVATSLLVFVCAIGGALFGMFLRRLLPKRHISPDSKEVVRVGMGTGGDQKTWSSQIAETIKAVKADT